MKKEDRKVVKGVCRENEWISSRVESGKLGRICWQNNRVELQNLSQPMATDPGGSGESNRKC